MNASSDFSDLNLQTGSVLEKQFETSYLPHVFNVTLPWCVGGPDFPRKQRFRRRFDELSPAVDLDTWVALMACRCESQMRAGWNFLPGIMSLLFAFRVNLGMSMSMNRALRRGADTSMADGDIGKATTRIYELPWTGEYMHNGQRLPIRGDISKIEQIIGLTDTEKALIRNYHF